MLAPERSTHRLARNLDRQLTRRHELSQVHFERLHPVGVHAAFHNFLQGHVALRLAYALARRPSHDQRFAHQRHTVPGSIREVGAAQRRPQIVREALAHLTRIVVRRQRNDTTHGASDIWGMQRRQHEVARLGGLERDVHRHLIANFAKQDDVRDLGATRP